MIRPPNLIFLAGPNGSGKSTFFDRPLAKWNLAFVNPDVIAKQIAPEDPSGATFRANAITKAQRIRLLESGESFVTEGIRPDLKLIEEAKKRGYYTRVIFVCVKSPTINVTRGKLRVSEGGHSVPLGAVVARYPAHSTFCLKPRKLPINFCWSTTRNGFAPTALLQGSTKGK